VQYLQKKKGIEMTESDFLERYPFRNKPFLHQQAYLQRFWRRLDAALLADMGTGKSFMLINNAAMLYDRGKIDAMLVVAPKGVYRNWLTGQIPEHMPEHLPVSMACWSASPRKAEKEAMDKMLNSVDSFRILVMNVEAFSTEKGVAFAQLFLRVTKAFMAVDESTTIKTPKAKRTKNIIKVGKLAKFKRIATGSPVTKSPLDLYSQFEFLNPDILDQPSFFAFQARYAVVIERKMATHTFKQVVGYRKLDELQKKVTEASFRVTKEECLDLPPKVYTRRDVELTDEQVKAYNQMKEVALAEIDGGLMSTNNALTQLMRLHQIVCGHVKLDDGTVLDLPSNRMDELLSAVEETDGKVIIWANYRKDIEGIKNALQKAYGMNTVATYFGDTPDAERQEIVEAFQDPANTLRFFVGNPSTGGYGLTLTAAHTMIYYSNSFDLEKRLQSEDRAHRIGQTKSVTYIDLIAVGTVDEHIVKSLRNKINIAGEVLGEKLKDWIV
jgi:SNF2 family DNA or RNA helicase